MLIHLCILRVSFKDRNLYFRINIALHKFIALLTLESLKHDYSFSHDTGDEGTKSALKSLRKAQNMKTVFSHHKKTNY